jgi:ferredoxin, 2Fe-2S
MAEADKMPSVTYVEDDGTPHTVDVSIGTSLMIGALAGDVPGILAECGGQAMCATCHVYIDPRWRVRLDRVSEEEDERLDEVLTGRTAESRLSCQLIMTEQLDGLVVRLPAAQA